MEDPFLESLPLDSQVRQDVKIHAHDTGIEGSMIEFRSTEDNLIQPDGFMLEHHVVVVEECKVNVLESIPCKIRQNVQFSSAGLLSARRHHRQIIVAIRTRRSGCP